MKISKTRLMQIIKEEFEANSSPYALYIQKEPSNFKLVIYLWYACRRQDFRTLYTRNI
jgi:hypothetical protein